MEKHVSLSKVAILLISIVLTSVITACSKKSTEQYISDAQAYLANEEVERAVIELKSAIVNAPRDIESRLLLGKTYYQLSQFANAEKELETAKDLGANEDSYFFLLLASQYYQNNFAEAQLTSETYNGNDEKIKNQAKLYNFLSAIRVDDTPPSIPDGLTGNVLVIAEANQALLERRPTKTLELADAVSNFSSSEIVELNIIKGIALTSLGRVNEAKDAYQKVVDIFPHYYFARFQLIETLTTLELLEETRKHLDFMFEIKPDSPLTHYYSAIVDFKQNDFEQAFQSATIAASGSINDIELYFIAGVSAYKTGKIESAYNFLNRNKNRVPSNHLNNKILAEVSLKLGYSMDVIAELEGLKLKPSNQSIVFSAAAINQFQLGNFEQATDFIGQATKHSPQDAVLLLQEGLIKLSSNDLSGIDSLTKSIEYNPSLDESWLLLAEAYLKQGEHDAAISVAQKWQELNKLDGLNLEGYLRLKMGQTKQAMEIFGDILKEEPEHSGATRYLMLAHANAREFPEAKAYAQTLIKQNPNSIINLVSYINLHIGSNKSETAEAFLLKEIENKPVNQEMLVALSMLMTWKKEHEKALKLLKEKGNPNHSLVQKTKGDLYHFLTRFDEAINEYDAWLKKDQRNPEAWFKKIQVVQDQGIAKKGLRVVKEALQHFPNDPRLIGLHAYFLARNGKVEDAKYVMQNLNGYQEKLPIIDYYNGYIALEDGKFQQAYSLLQKYYDVEPNFETATQLSRALEEIGKPEEGLALLKHEVSKLYKPFIERHRIAEYMVNNKMLERATDFYDQLFKDYPLDFVTINNYAALLTKVGELDKAEQLATVGLRLQPASPYAMDTLGRVFFKQGKTKEALFYAEKAHQAFPQNAEIQLHLAEILLADNQVNRAKILINRVKPVTKIEKDLLADIQATL